MTYSISDIVSALSWPSRALGALAALLLVVAAPVQAATYDLRVENATVEIGGQTVTKMTINGGVLSEVPWWGLAAFSLGVIAALSVWMVRTPSRWIAVSLGLVIGGATGNAFDRFRHGAVTDFIDVHLSGFHWPTFNLADAAIALGVGLLLLESVLARNDRKNAPPR